MATSMLVLLAKGYIVTSISVCTVPLYSVAWGPTL